MWITNHIDTPCPYCGEVGRYGNINVGENVLNRGCNGCGQWFRHELPKLTKSVLYLDQFFLSHAFRNNEMPFVDAANRIKDMASRQLLVCPYSSVHTDETHLWRHEQREQLYAFIKQTARGYKFKQAYEIKKTQMHKAFEEFITNAPLSIEVMERDAFRDNIHRWDDYIWIDVKPFLGDLEAMRQAKANSISALVDLFPDWKQLTTSYEEDVAEEARGYGRSLLNLYMEMVATVATGNLFDYMDAPADTMYVESLLYRDSHSMSIEERLRRIANFFGSSHFLEIPNIKISCGLFAILRKMVKNGSYTNPENAKRKLGGLFYDSECISVFGPYCDAIFIDRSMQQWCEDPDATLFGNYKTSLFSAHSWDEFHSYLDDVEAGFNEDILRGLKLVYPGVYV